MRKWDCYQEAVAMVGIGKGGRLYDYGREGRRGFKGVMGGIEFMRYGIMVRSLVMTGNNSMVRG